MRVCRPQFISSLIVGLVLLPSLAGAAEPSAEAPPSWSLGAGVVLSRPLAGLVPLGGVGVGAVGGLGGTGVDPSLSVTVERRISDDAWLMFRGSASLGSVRSGETAYTADDRRFAGSAGLRFVLLDSSVVSLSTFGLVGVNVGTSEVTLPMTIADGSIQLSTVESSALTLGASGGVGLERELMDGLSLRLASSVLGASWSRVSAVAASGSEQVTRALSARLELEPSLELRLVL